MISGDADPVGEFGRGVKQVATDLKNTGHNVELKLYKDSRHEILNDFDRQIVMEDVINWLDANVTEKKPN